MSSKTPIRRSARLGTQLAASDAAFREVSALHVALATCGADRDGSRGRGAEWHDSGVQGKTSRHLVGVAALMAALVGCSSSGSAPAPTGTTPNDSANTAAIDQIQTYLDAVNARCDALLPKIVRATHGGSIDVPVRAYLATWPAHKQLLAGFDSQVAAIPVPVAARSKAATLAAYVRFADRLDAARLAAAKEGQAAYRNEVRSESGVENDPAITALTTAGFNTSCTAR